MRHLPALGIALVAAPIDDELLIAQAGVQLLSPGTVDLHGAIGASEASPLTDTHRPRELVSSGRVENPRANRVNGASLQPSATLPVHDQEAIAIFMNQVDAGVMLRPVPELKKKTWLVASIADEMAILFRIVGAGAPTATKEGQRQKQ